MSEPMLVLEFTEYGHDNFKQYVKSTFKRGPFRDLVVEYDYIYTIYPDGSSDPPQETIAMRGQDGGWFLIKNRGRDHISYDKVEIKIWDPRTSTEEDPTCSV